MSDVTPAILLGRWRQ